MCLSEAVGEDNSHPRPFFYSRWNVTHCTMLLFEISIYSSYPYLHLRLKFYRFYSHSSDIEFHFQTTLPHVWDQSLKYLTHQYFGTRQVRLFRAAPIYHPFIAVITVDNSHTYATSRSCMPLDVSPWAGTKDPSTGRLEGDAIGDGGFSCLISPASSWFVPSIVTWSCWSQLNFPFWVYSGILWSNLRIISENDRRWRKGDSFDGRWAIRHPNMSRVAKHHCVCRKGYEPSTKQVRNKFRTRRIAKIPIPSLLTSISNG